MSFFGIISRSYLAIMARIVIGLPTPASIALRSADLIIYPTVPIWSTIKISRKVPGFVD